jgi:3-oxoadipate enol-lactonase
VTGALACERGGDGPLVVLVHGVGIGPWSYAAVAAALAADHTVLVAHRRGYGSSRALPPPASLAEQVDDLAALVDGPAAFVGVSGGATLVLALALARPARVSAAVVHEPALGPLAPELDAELQAAGAALAASDGDPAGAVRFVRGLVGDAGWERLGPDRRGDVAALAGAVRHEVPQFLSFAPHAGELAVAAPVATAVGAASRPSRHRAAAILARHLGTTPTVLPATGHLAQLDNPAALAGALRQAEALHRRGRGHQDVLPTRRGDEL